MFILIARYNYMLAELIQMDICMNSVSSAEALIMDMFTKQSR